MKKKSITPNHKTAKPRQQEYKTPSEKVDFLIEINKLEAVILTKLKKEL